MAMVAPYPIGFETGNASEINTLGTNATVQNTVVLSGAYSLKQEGTASVISTGHALASWAFRFHVRFTGGWYNRSLFEFRSASSTTIWTLDVDASQLLRVTQVASIGLTQSVGVTPLELDKSYSIKVAFAGASSGLLKVWLSDGLPAGQAEIDVTHSSSASNLERVVVNWSTTGNNVYLDDLALFNTADRPPDGKVAGRQGRWLAPTYDAWIKTDTQQVSYVWSQAAGASTASDNGASAQTMYVARFSRGTPIKDQHQGTSNWSFKINGGTGTSGEADQAQGQSFICGLSGNLLRVAVSAVRQGSVPTDNVTMEILSGSITGTVIGTSEAIAVTNLPMVDSTQTDPNSVYFEFPAGVTLSAGTTYYLRVTRSGARDTSKGMIWYADQADSYASGERYVCSDNTWTSVADDMCFTTYMEAMNTDMFPVIPDSIDSIWVVNACKSVVVAKRGTGSASTHSLRRRVAGVDTDTTLTLTTSDATYQDGPWTTTQDNLDSIQIGGNRSGGGQQMIIGEAWLMVDYEPLRQVQNATLEAGEVRVDLLYLDSSNEVRAIKVWNSLGVNAVWRVISGAVDETITITGGVSAQVINLTTAVTDSDGLETSLGLA
jgi:hypothetical protein